MIKKITVVLLLFEKSKFISVGHDAGQAFMIYKRSDNLILRNEISKDDIYLGISKLDCDLCVSGDGWIF